MYCHKAVHMQPLSLPHLPETLVILVGTAMPDVASKKIALLRYAGVHGVCRRSQQRWVCHSCRVGKQAAAGWPPMGGLVINALQAAGRAGSAAVSAPLSRLHGHRTWSLDGDVGELG